MQYLITALLVTTALQSLPAQPDQDFEVVPLEGLWAISDMTLSPDGSRVLLVREQNALMLYDYQTRQPVKEFHPLRRSMLVRAEWNTPGNLVLVRQASAFQVQVNKKKPILVEVVDVESGKAVFSKDGVFDAALDYRHRFVACLEGSDAVVYGLDGKEHSRINLPGRAFAIASSPKADVIAVAHKPSKAELKNDPTYKMDKKGLKFALKNMIQISFYEVQTGKLLYKGNQLVHVVFAMKFDPSGKSLMVYEKPHTRVQSAGGHQTFVTIVEAETGTVSRLSFPSLAHPGSVRYHLDPSGNYFGISSAEQGKPAVHVYDLATGKMASRFNVFTRHFQVLPGNYPSFTFLPDNRILIAFGNNLAIWNFKPNQ